MLTFTTAEREGKEMNAGPQLRSQNPSPFLQNLFAF